MTRFLRLFRSLLQGRPSLVVWVFTSGFAIFAGPFGTFSALTVGERAVFWCLTVAVFLVLGLALKAVIQTILPDIEAWTETLILAISATLIFSPMLYVLILVFVDPNSPARQSLLEMGSFILLVPVAATAFQRISQDPYIEFAPPEPPAEPRLFQRLPEESGRRILRISVRDHYVEVVTDRSSETLLMRFSDAIAEAEGIPGLQVHRSHWVAEDAVTGVDREKGRMFLTLVDGSRIPVSRGFRDAVEEAGIADSAA